MGPDDVANIIERFIEGKGTEWEWDDFISIRIHDSELDKIRTRCLQLDKEFPSQKTGQYTNEQGIEVLKNYVSYLRSKFK